VQALRRLQEQMEIVAEGFKRHSGMQLHLDALTHQYKHLNESMAALTAATQALGGCVQQLQQQQGVQQTTSQPGNSNSYARSSTATGAAAGQGAWLSSSWLQGVAVGSSSGVGLAVLGAGMLVGAAAGAVLSRVAASR
jgi:hypothetical protein